MLKFLKLLVQGCSNEEIAEQPSISPRTVKQHFRTLFLRTASGWPQRGEADDRDVPEGAVGIMPPRDRLTGKEVDVAVLVSEDLTNREIACAIGTTEQVVKNYLRPTFDKLGGSGAAWNWRFMWRAMAA